jgi:hypothetical protein
MNINTWCLKLRNPPSNPLRTLKLVFSLCSVLFPKVILLKICFWDLFILVMKLQGRWASYISLSDQTLLHRWVCWHVVTDTKKNSLLANGRWASSMASCSLAVARNARPSVLFCSSFATSRCRSLSELVNLQNLFFCSKCTFQHNTCPKIIRIV